MRKFFVILSVIKNPNVREAAKEVVQNITHLVVDSTKLVRAIFLALFRPAA